MVVYVVVAVVVDVVFAVTSFYVICKWLIALESLLSRSSFAT